MVLKPFGRLYWKQKMSDKNPIFNKREIENQFEEYLRKESKDRFYLRKKIGVKRLTKNYLRNARHNLLVGKMMMGVVENAGIKEQLVLPDDFQCYSWVIAISYYAMYHAALSALAKQNYKSDDHQATKYALAKLYVIKDELEKEALELFDQGKKILEEEYIITLDDARKKDRAARYSADPEYEKSKAQEIMQDAKKFVKRLAEIIEFKEEK